MPDLCTHCIEGVRHEGAPEGRFEDIGGIRTYVALPTDDYPHDKAVLFLTDAFGPELLNNLLLADDFARNGFQVYLPDLFDGDPVPEDAISLNATVSAQFDIRAWLARHSFEESLPKVEAVIHALKDRGVRRFGRSGSATAIYAQKAVAPLLLNTCEVDSQFAAEKQARADEVLGGGKFKCGYERTYWPGCTHGFAVRGDLSDPNVKAGKERSFEASARWFLEHL